MRKYLIYTVMMVLSTFVSSAQPKVEFTEWQNPEINQIFSHIVIIFLLSVR